MSEVFNNRKIIYCFLSRIYEKEITEKDLSDIAIAKWDEDVPYIDLKRGIKILLNFLKKSSYYYVKKELLNLSVDFANLFLGINGLPRPCESSYRSSQNVVDDVLFTYWEYGVTKTKEFKEFPDHISVELQFVAYLCQKSIDALAKKDLREVQRYLQTQKDFVDTHLFKWIPQLADNVLERSKTDFYKAMALITKGFLKVDKMILEYLVQKKEGFLSKALTKSLAKIAYTLNFLKNNELTLLRKISQEEAEELKKEANDIKVSYVCTNLLGFTSAYLPSEVHIRNGRILRIKPLTSYNFSYKIKARDRVFTRPAKTLQAPYELAFKQRVYSSNRVGYPLKRVDFDPKGSRNPQNRGKSGYIRISWEEALEIIASEIKRIKETYGTYAIAVLADGHGQSSWQTLHFYAHELFEHMGGCTHIIRNPDSWEGYYWGAKHVWGGEGLACGWHYQDAIYEDVLENTDLIILSGADPETTSWGFCGQSGSIVMHWLKQAGIKIIAVAPDANYTTVKWADKWIPIMPNTDAALYLAIAYLWIKEGTYDKEYVETHTYGFEEFRKYVLGEEDGVPKTPEWASRVTGIPKRIIKALARVWASKRTAIGVVFGGPKIRGPYSTEPARLEAILLAMQGLGKPGVHHIKLLPTWTLGRIVHGVPTRVDVFSGTRMTMTSASMPRNPVVDWGIKPFSIPFIPKTLLPDAILNPPISWYGTGAIVALKEDQFVKYSYPAEGYPEIHMIFDENSCWITCWNEGYKMIEALRSPKIEFIVAVHPWFENCCKFADIILPAATVFETEDMSDRYTCSEYVIAYWTDKSVDPIGESKTDYEIMRLIAQKLGLNTYLDAFPEFEKFAKKLYDESICREYMSWEEFKEKKLFYLPPPSLEEWEEIKKTFNVKPGLRAFYENPESNPLETPSGKIEIYSTGLAENFPDDKERPPLPHYIPYGETHQESILHPRAKNYPFLIVSNHPRWRMHAENDDISWLKEISTCKMKGPDGYLYEPVWIHPQDAEKRGIKHGDIVMVYNERGSVLGGAYVTERIMPGVVSMDHGAQVDLISIDDKIDKGGAINLICPSKTTSKNVPGMVVSAFLVNVKKVI